MKNEAGNPRKLPYPLFRPETIISSGPQSGSINNLKWPTSDPDEQVKIELRLSLKQYVKIASAIDAGRDIAYGSDSENIWWLWNVALASIQTVVNQVLAIATGGGIVYVNEDTDSMRFYTEDSNGTTFLVEDCGCGKVRKFALTEVGADYGSDPLQASGGWPSNAIGVTGSSVDCYGTKAADILTTRFKDFAGRVLDVLVFGYDAFESGTEIIDAAGELIDIITNRNKYDGLLQETKTAVYAAIDLYSQTLANNWGYQGEITRGNLFELADATYPLLEGAIPLRFLSEKWTATANIRSINAQLSIAAAECERGYNLPADTKGFTANGNEYLLIQLTDTVQNVLTADALYTLATNTPAGVKGLLYEVLSKSGTASCGAGNPRAWVDDTSGQLLSAGNMNNIPIGFNGAGESFFQTPIENLLGMTFAAYNPVSETGTGDIQTDVSCAFSGNVEFGNIYVVTDA